MDNNMILSRQNEEQNINLLMAQRQLYFEAKKIMFYQFIANILVPMILPFLKKRFSNSYKGLAFISMFSILILILNFCFLEKASKSKR